MFISRWPGYYRFQVNLPQGSEVLNIEKCRDFYVWLSQLIWFRKIPFFFIEGWILILVGIHYFKVCKLRCQKKKKKWRLFLAQWNISVWNSLTKHVANAHTLLTDPSHSFDRVWKRSELSLRKHEFTYLPYLWRNNPGPTMSTDDNDR